MDFKNLGTGLAWLWVLCLVATVLDLAGILQFASRSVASGVHWAVLGLAFGAAVHWPLLKPLPWVLGGLLLAATLLWVVSPALSVFGYFTQLPGKYACSLFLDSGDNAIWRWKNTHVDCRRGRALVVQQYYASMPGFGGGGEMRTVQLVPVTPLWYWVRNAPRAPQGQRSPATLAAQGWVAVNRNWTDFSFDPAEQRWLDAAKAQRDAEDLRVRQAYEADPANQAMSEAIKRDAEQNRLLDSLQAIRKSAQEDED